jgi:hypothetical protein
LQKRNYVGEPVVKKIREDIAADLEKHLEREERRKAAL